MFAKEEFGRFGSSSKAKPQDGCFLVIVHPSGELDDPELLSFWSEVPEFVACAAEGQTVEGVVEASRRNILEWIRQKSPSSSPSNGSIKLKVELAF